MSSSKRLRSADYEDFAPCWSTSTRFERFWSSYPRKVGKGAARRAFEKIAPDDALTDQLIAAVERCKALPQWQRDGGAFIPHPRTWLHQERWQDEPESATGALDPTPRELQDARAVRDRSWGGCRHEPRCASQHQCLTAIVYEMRERT